MPAFFSCSRIALNDAILNAIFRRVDIVVATVLNDSFHAHNFALAKWAFLQSSLEAMRDRWDVLLWNTTTSDLVHEFVWLFGVFRKRFNVTFEVSVLTRTTGLLLMLVVVLDFLGWGFTVSNTWLTNDALALVLTLNAFDVNVQVQLGPFRR